MPRIRRPSLAVEADRRNREQLARAGADLREARMRRHLTQALVAERAGIGRMVVSRVERGLGSSVTLDAWQRIGLAVGRPLVIGLQRDVAGETADAGHLAMQELILRLGRRAGFDGTFELTTRSAEPWRSIDVGLAQPSRCLLIVVECWNTIGDVGAAVRTSMRKLAETESVAVARWGTAPSIVGLVWVVRATARNRALVARYPEVFGSRFPGSSAAWIATLTEASQPPALPGLVWANISATRLFAWRRRAL